MAVTSQVTTFADLVEDLSNRARIQTGITATSDVAKRYINTSLQDMHLGFGEKFPWAHRTGELVTQAEYNTGTVTITQGSTSLSGTSTTWDTNNAFSVKNMRVGGRIVIAGGVEIYEISSVTNDTAAVLTAAFVKDDVSAAEYLYFEDEYDLASDFLRPLDLQNFDTNGDIDLIGRTEFRWRYPRSKVTGKPRVATIIDRVPSGGTTPRRRVRFWKPPSEAFLIPYSYVTSNLATSSSGTAQANLSADTDEPIVPLHGRHAIVYHALANWYRDKKDDARSLQVKGEYTDIILRLVGDQEIGSSRPRFQPRISPYVRKARTPFRGRRSGRYTTGGSFDEIR